MQIIKWLFVQYNNNPITETCYCMLGITVLLLIILIATSLCLHHVNRHSLQYR